ncbi:hypothetical protein PYCCODRAFT_1262223 [Trametes coccinea BRFM310]|uniref:F-box domain-containing protein n=1 Tax=Trametes coccinea (strain BRFM310) TaxID=1353009 RepID=A0A1Y2I664_TRAC3|nr:hypothetical protein PYCCODRAFT_1262223 [Trametes coccinea BRFM310]
MSSPRLPLDLCEEVIDRCAPPQWDALMNIRFWSSTVAESAKALIACALTCRAWVQRSIFCYYSTCLLLEDAESVDRLVGTISRNPGLAVFVRILSVRSGVEDYNRSPPSRQTFSSKYIPFRRTDLARTLQNIETIVYSGRGPWPYPPNAQFPRPIDLCRLIWALEQLQTLHLHKIEFDRILSGGEDPLDPGYETLRKMAMLRPRCQSLKTLMIDRTVSRFQTFPYGYVFGTSLTRWGVSVSIADSQSWRFAEPHSHRSLDGEKSVALIFEEDVAEQTCKRASDLSLYCERRSFGRVPVGDRMHATNVRIER